MLHAHAEREPPDRPIFAVPSGAGAGSEMMEQLQLFSLGGTPATPPELLESDEECPGDLLGMYFLG
ncbi:MAG: hypothetical protein RI637_06835 [Acidimicrobiia bacterium]|nr:hypothetical protein [Acidimicrobiia bacterium]